MAVAEKKNEMKGRTKSGEDATAVAWSQSVGLMHRHEICMTVTRLNGSCDRATVSLTPCHGPKSDVCTLTCHDGGARTGP